MKTELILKSDVLDILFENRNKAYGAYDLRKFYDNRLMKSLAAMLGIVLVLSAFTFMPDKKKTVEMQEDLITTTIFTQPEKKVEPVVKKETPAAAQTPVSTKIFVKNIVITTDSVPPIDVITDNDRFANKTSDATGSGPGIVQPPAGDGDGKGTITEPVKTEPVDNVTPTETAEEMPSFPGGMEALKKFLQRNLTNPRDLEDGEMVSVRIKFVVGYDGKLKGFTTVQDGGEEFNKEVVRVLKKMPEWVPGKTRGQNVSVYYVIPVKFVSYN
ncbi:energy transducer TonB [Ferruginibacter sp.]|nr:energy transducer TonB [Ferruginibacter sp.]